MTERRRVAAVAVLCVLMLTVAAGRGLSAPDDIAVYVNGERLACDVPPTIESGRVLVPMRVIFEALGAEIEWDGASRTVTASRGDDTISLQVGSSLAWVSGELIALDVPARIIGDRTMVPLRFVGEALGADVSWNEVARAVTVTFGGPLPPLPPPPEPPTPPLPEPPVEPPPAPTGAEVHFIDVGQGDCVLIRWGADGFALIDGGPGKSEGAVLAYLAAEGVDHLDLVVATHPHEDHIGGLDAVIAALPTTRVIDPGMTATTSAYANYVAAVDASGAAYEVAHAGSTYTLGTGATLRVVYPPPGAESFADANSASVACVFTYGTVDVLLTGDLPTSCEAGVGSDVEALKVAHHGSATSTSAAFLVATTPGDAVISVGAGNSYGHPTADALNRLEAAGVRIYRTDEQGTVVLATDGATYSFSVQPWWAPCGAGHNFAASREGEKYHYPWCRYVPQISPQNLIWFATAAAARAAGYAPCSVCSPP